MKPYVDDNGVPCCSYDGCPDYDGKRCEQLGCRPTHVCEPAVIDLVAELRRLRSERATGGSEREPGEAKR